MFLEFKSIYVCVFVFIYIYIYIYISIHEDVCVCVCVSVYRCVVFCDNYIHVILIKLWLYSMKQAFN